MRDVNDMGREATEARDLDRIRCSLAEIAAEAWRMDRLIRRLIHRVDPLEANRFQGQYNWFQRRVDEALVQAGVQVVDLTGQPYSEGMAATPMNIAELDGDDLVVAQTVEPVILCEGRVLKTGKLLLKEAGT